MWSLHMSVGDLDPLEVFQEGSDSGEASGQG